MKTLFELMHEKNCLPSGNIYKKVINGKTYFYYQYRENGKNFSRLIKKEQINSLLNDIEKRKEIEKEIKRILAFGNREIELSNFAREYTGYLMCEDKVIGTFEKGVLISGDEKMLPLVFKRTTFLTEFLKSRSIDSGRTNSRILRKILNINVKDDTLVSLCSYAASITDNYWFKPKHSKLTYKDIAFNNDMFFETALKGLITFYPKKIVLTPELTTNGSYEKGWKNENGEWRLYKVGSNEEIYSELFYSILFETIGLPTAHYELSSPFIKTKNFAKNVNFEPMVYIAGENEDFIYIYNLLNKFNHQIALDYLRLIVFDVILYNVDRHNENCGILRNKKTGAIISLAPNYDNNLCLISRTKELNLSRNEGFLDLFVKTIRKNSTFKSILKEISFPVIDEKILDNVNDKINMNVNVDFKKIKEFILMRYKYILEEINK